MKCEVRNVIYHIIFTTKDDDHMTEELTFNSRMLKALSIKLTYDYEVEQAYHLEDSGNL